MVCSAPTTRRLITGARISADTADLGAALVELAKYRLYYS